MFTLQAWFYLNIINFLEKDLRESKDTEVSNGSEEDDIQEVQPFKYMLGNLMKKMDDKKTKTCTDKELCPITNIVSEQKRKLAQAACVQHYKSTDTWYKPIPIPGIGISTFQTYLVSVSVWIKEYR